jgi:3-oxoacyl-[acyl-carrier-protein] synthase III
MTTPISLAGVASYLPDNVIDNQFFTTAQDATSAERSPMFHAPAMRRHIGENETAVDMIERAASALFGDLGSDARQNVDIVLTNVSLPDQVFTGCGAEVARRLGCSPTWVLDLHNSGCVSFIYMIEYAHMIMQSRGARTALICNAQPWAGRVCSQPKNRSQPQSAIPGDGCGVAYMVASDESPVVALSQRCYADFAGDMTSSRHDGRRHWETGNEPLTIHFDESRIAQIIARGNRLVPEMVKRACEQAGVSTRDIDILITNQPNQLFLRNWREALQVPKASHPDTFDKYGNLFGAAIPITLAEVIARGAIEPDDVLVLGGFAHAGDYAAAAVIRWHARS